MTLQSSVSQSVINFIDLVLRHIFRAFIVEKTKKIVGFPYNTFCVSTIGGASNRRGITD